MYTTSFLLTFKISFFVVVALLPISQVIAETVSSNPSLQPKVVISQPPIAKKIKYKHSYKYLERQDYYHWLRDDTRSKPEVLAYLQQWNDYTNHALKSTETLQQRLLNEFTSRIEKNSSSVPIRKGSYWYQYHYTEQQEYPIYVRKHYSKPQIEEVLFDGNLMSKNLPYFAISNYEVSPDEKLMAIAIDEQGRRLYSIKVLNLNTGRFMPQIITGTTSDIAWAADSSSLFYIKRDTETLLGYQVYRHQLDIPQEFDQLIYEEKDNSFYTSLSTSRDLSDIFIHHHSTTKKYASRIDAQSDNPISEIFFKPTEALNYHIQKLGNYYYVRTDLDTKNYRIMRFNRETAANPATWEAITSIQPKVYLQDFLIFKNFLVTLESNEGQQQLVIQPLNDNGKITGAPKQVQWNDTIFTLKLRKSYQIEPNQIYVEYSSLTTPNTTFEVDLTTLKPKMIKQVKIPDFSPDNYTSERVKITARDGTSVPISLVYHKERFKKHQNPILLYAYGAYGISVQPRFNSRVLSLLDRGFVYAIVHARGGSFLGPQWYEAGKLLQKKNTFYDFIDATKSLVKMGYGHKEKVFARGGSAGGLLMGAIANMAPELYLAIGAHVPFVDIISTMLDPSLPLTTNEYDEWGNPNDKAYHDYMFSYSPYDQVSSQHYPHLLVTSGLHDSQVQYFEPTKWVAKLLDKKSDDNLLLLHTNLEAGHSGASGRFKRLKSTVMEYAFYLKVLEDKAMTLPKEISIQVE